MGLQPVSNSSSFPAVFGDAGIELRRGFTYRSALYPAVLPELGGRAIANLHEGGGEEERVLGGRELEFETTPCVLVVGAVEPLASQPQCEAGTLHVLDARPSRGRGRHTRRQLTWQLPPLALARPAQKTPC